MQYMYQISVFAFAFRKMRHTSRAERMYIMQEIASNYVANVNDNFRMRVTESVFYHHDGIIISIIFS